MRLKIYGLLILLAGLSYSCETESLFEHQGDGTLLKKVLIGGEVYSEFTYNVAGLINEEKSKYHYSKHNYNAMNRLIQSDHYWDESIASSSSYVLEEAEKREEWVNPTNTEKDTYSTFKYNGDGRLEKITTYRLNSDYTSYSMYSYNKQGRIERRTSYHNEKASMYDDYSYDDLGNVIKKERYYVMEKGASEIQTTTVYEYDNMHNPYLSFRGLMMPGRNTNPNNITKQTYTLHMEVDDFIDQIQITEYSYEYNSEGYPVLRSDSYEYIYF